MYGREEEAREGNKDLRNKIKRLGQEAKKWGVGKDVR